MDHALNAGPLRVTPIRSLVTVNDTQLNITNPTVQTYNRTILTTPEGMCLSPHLEFPDTSKGTAGTYSLELLLTAEDSQSIIANADAVADQFYRKRLDIEQFTISPEHAARLKPARPPYRWLGDKSCYFTFMRPAGMGPPRRVDSEGTIIRRSVGIAEGSRVSVTYEVVEYCSPLLMDRRRFAGSRLRLIQVQVHSLVNRNEAPRRSASGPRGFQPSSFSRPC